MKQDLPWFIQFLSKNETVMFSEARAKLDIFVDYFLRWVCIGLRIYMQFQGIFWLPNVLKSESPQASDLVPLKCTRTNLRYFLSFYSIYAVAN